MLGKVAALLSGVGTVLMQQRVQPTSQDFDNAVSFAEVLHASDVPGGVVNILTGYRGELPAQIASNMDVNAVVHCDGDAAVAKDIQQQAADNIKRVVARTRIKWSGAAAANP